MHVLRHMYLNTYMACTWAGGSVVDLNLGAQGPGPGSRAPKLKSTTDPPAQVHAIYVFKYI